MKQKQTWPSLQFNCCLKTGFFDKDATEKLVPANKKQSLANRHRTRPQSSQKRKPLELEPNLTATKSIKEYSVYRVGSKSSSKRVAFFTNPLPASKIAELESIQTSPSDNNGKKDRTKIIDQTGSSFKTENYSELFKNPNLHDFDAVFCDQNVRANLYSKTFEQTVQRVFAGQKTTALLIGERDTRRKARFFLNGTSVFQKFLADLQSKFEIFQRGEEAECGLSRKVSVFGLFGNRVFDFLKGGEKNESSKISKTAINSRAELEEFLDKLKATFNVSKTLSYKQKSIVLLVKVFIGIRDKLTNIKLRTSHVNFVIADCTHFDKGLLSDVKESLVQGASLMSPQSKKGKSNVSWTRPNDRKEETRNLNEANTKTLTSIFAADAIQVYWCLNASFKNSEVNKRLLEFHKEILNEIKLSRSLAKNDLGTQLDSTTNDPSNTIASRKSGLAPISQDKLRNNLEFIERTLKSLEEQIAQVSNVSRLDTQSSQLAHIANMLQLLEYDFNEMKAYLSPKALSDMQARINALNDRLGWGQNSKFGARLFNQVEFTKPAKARRPDLLCFQGRRQQLR